MIHPKSHHKQQPVTIKYAVRPGYVDSKKDRDRHYIGFGRLCELYGVDPRECVDLSRPESYLGRDVSRLQVLRPLYDGDYPTLR